MFKRLNAKSMRECRGFTLVEMSIVLIIVGLVLGSVAQLYKQRLQFLKAEDARNDVAGVTGAINTFLQVNGRYPCPASLTAARDDAGEYGREGDCTNAGLTIAANGIQAFTPPLPEPQRTIHIGTVPFKELNIDESMMIDGYHNRLIYAVTSALTSKTDFDPSLGGITIKDDTGIDADGNLIDDNDVKDIHFILFSTGENGIGGYSREGTRVVDCPVIQTFESLNCDMADNVFASSSTTSGFTNNKDSNDDVISYSTYNEMPKWENDETEGDVAPKMPGSIGFGPDASDNPAEEVDITGVIRTQDDPSTEDEVEGKIQSSAVCSYNARNDGSNECFSVDLLTAAEAHETMRCPEGQYAVGLHNNALDCRELEEIVVECPEGNAMIGIDDDGEAVCEEPPETGCPDQPELICTETQTLVGGPHGTTRTLTAGASRKEKYRCNDGTWVRTDTDGVCECTPGIEATESRSCARSWSGDCGDRYTGLYDREYRRYCPSGDAWWSAINFEENCTCIETSETRTRGCPTGFNVGERTETNTHDCSTETCGGWIETSNSCACEAERETRWRSCPSGATGNYQQERFFNCSGGADEAGSWTDWEDVEGSSREDRCSCVEKEETTPDTCPAGQFGDIETHVEYTCPDPYSSPVIIETPIINTPCRPLSELTCSLSVLPGSGTGTHTEYPSPSVPKTGGSCNCADHDSGSMNCYDRIGSSSRWEMSQCKCEIRF